MLLVLLTAVILPFVVCDPDSSKVCLPDKIQFNTYSIETDVNAVVAIDYTRKLLGTRSTNNSVVDDLATGKSYVTDASGSCQQYLLPLDKLYPQCLPAGASFGGDIYIGFGPNRVPAEAWESPYNGGILRMAFSNQPGQPRYPILAKFIDGKGDRFTTFYFNPNETISAANIFDIPDPCPPATFG
ncbi:unnamed protein product [Lymnaea stagnalis]|uniref:Uncharacterized protein n=1 Tax=Lymnaea stagnalis TaxID=6523 RepID=A0AAV2ID62_LYMST